MNIGFFKVLAVIPAAYVLGNDLASFFSPPWNTYAFVYFFSFWFYLTIAISLDNTFKAFPFAWKIFYKVFPFLYREDLEADASGSNLFSFFLATLPTAAFLYSYEFYISMIIILLFGVLWIIVLLFVPKPGEMEAKDAKRKAKDEAWKAKKLAEDEAWKAKKLAEDEAWKIEKAERKARYKAKMAAMDVEIAERRAKADAKWEAEKAAIEAKGEAWKAAIEAKGEAWKAAIEAKGESWKGNGEADIAAKDAEWNSKEAEKKAKIAARDALRKDEHAKTVQQLKEEYIDTKRQIKENYAKGKERRLQLIAARKARVAAYSPLQKTLYYLAYILPGVIAIALFLYFFLQYKPL